MENFRPLVKKTPVESFQELSLDTGNLSLEKQAFENLERALFENGFVLADAIDASNVLRSETLMCRSEQFSKVINLIDSKQPIVINNPGNQANMCSMAAGRGFKVAMTEGFSGQDVGGLVKVVVSFRGEHLTQGTIVPAEDSLWQTKPETAMVSKVGKGEVINEDVEMLSFRFPVGHFPEPYMSEEEKDLLAEEGIKFVVRHYIPKEKTTIN